MLTKDPAYRAEQLSLYNSKHTGALTIARDGGNVVAYLPLRTITSEHAAIISLAKSQLPSAVYQTSDPALLTGYAAQRQIIYGMLNSSTSPIQETGWNTNSVMPLTILKPFSRGSINAVSKDIFAQPAIDFAVLSDPTDLEILIAIVQINRKMVATPAMMELGPSENLPGAHLTSKEQLRELIRKELNPTYVHPCCTASMMKKEFGGVVGADLKVYGTEGLSIVDASIFPLIPGTHPSATIYAVAEKVRNSSLFVCASWGGNANYCAGGGRYQEEI
jgi:choline dehydrogenase